MKCEVVVHAAAPAAAGATLEAPEPVDEIREFHEGSYVSSSEGIWRFCEFPMTSRIPNVVRRAPRGSANGVLQVCCHGHTEGTKFI